MVLSLKDGNNYIYLVVLNQQIEGKMLKMYIEEAHEVFCPDDDEEFAQLDAEVRQLKWE